MISDINSLEFNLASRFGFCNDVLIDNHQIKKIIWMVPHVIKNKGDSMIITWRCNWGNVCTSKCMYSSLRDRNEEFKAVEETLVKTR